MPGLGAGAWTAALVAARVAATAALTLARGDVTAGAAGVESGVAGTEGGWYRGARAVADGTRVWWWCCGWSAMVLTGAGKVTDDSSNSGIDR